MVGHRFNLICHHSCCQSALPTALVPPIQLDLYLSFDLEWSWWFLSWDLQHLILLKRLRILNLKCGINEKERRIGIFLNIAGLWAMDHGDSHIKDYLYLKNSCCKIRRIVVWKIRLVHHLWDRRKSGKWGAVCFTTVWVSV